MCVSSEFESAAGRDRWVFQELSTHPIDCPLFENGPLKANSS
jgi:hypothetical protein